MEPIKKETIRKFASIIHRRSYNHGSFYQGTAKDSGLDLILGDIEFDCLPEDVKPLFKLLLEG